jgi:hypothetical protein
VSATKTALLDELDTLVEDYSGPDCRHRMATFERMCEIAELLEVDLPEGVHCPCGCNLSPDEFEPEGS